MKTFTCKSRFWNYVLILIILEKLGRESKTLVHCNTTLILNEFNSSPTKPVNMDKQHLKLQNTKSVKDSAKLSKNNKHSKISKVQELSNKEMGRLIEMNESLIQRVKLRLTRSRDAKWASLSFSFICILLLFGVCYSKMWREYHSTASYQPLPLFMIKERVPFLEVIRRKIRLLKQLQKQKKNHSEELKRLIQENERYEMETMAKRLED